MVEGASKLFFERHGARVAVGLEDYNNAAVGRSARGAERREDFSRVVSVVINHQDPPLLSFDLEPSIGILECGRGETI